MAVGFPTKANWAAGDVLTASAQDDLAGTVNLLSNASAASGSQLVSNVAGTSFAYQATPSASNPVLNSGFNVWQRGTSIAVAASTNAYTGDRWMLGTGATQACVVARYATSDTTNLPFIQYCARVQRNSGQTGTAALSFYQSVESVNSIPFVGKSVTYSFYARKGADYSATSSALVANLFSGTGTDQNVITGYTGLATTATTTATLTATWQRFSVTGTVSSSATELAFGYTYTPVGTAGTNDYYEVTGVQIDIGSVALPFRTYAATYQGELAACQRYYYRLPATAVYTEFGLGSSGAGTTSANIQVQFPVTMRTQISSSIDFATLALTDWNSNFSASTVSLNTNSTTMASISVGGASGLTTYRPYALRANNSTSAYIGFSAEL